MAQDLFGTTPSFGGAFSADEATLTFDRGNGDNGGLGYLVQGLTAQYGRPVQRIYELGPEKRTYYVVGRPEGTMSIQRLAAPGPINQAFLLDFSNPCRVKNNNMTIRINPGIKDDKECQDTFLAGRTVASEYQFRYCLISSIQFSISVQAITLQEGLQLTFSSMLVNANS